MKVLTYSLHDQNASSGEYYKEAERFADLVLHHMEQGIMPIAQELRNYAETTGIEAPRTREEYAFDLLALGVLWRTYMNGAIGFASWKGHILRRLVRLRSQSRRLKPTADRARAAFNARWLVPAEAAAMTKLADCSPISSASSHPTLKKMDLLLLWLEASGEFRQETLRFRFLQHYLKRRTASGSRSILESALKEAAWFETAGAAALGRYTKGVEPFRANLHRGNWKREDALLRNRRQVEYHLNLFGADLMNRAYRSDYADSQGKAVLLPACLKIRGGSNCAASRSNEPSRCQRCVKDCRIAQIAEMGDREGFEVIIAPHESDAFSRSLTDRLIRERIGIIGVACALNLVSGGLQAKALGIPAQCVILDYCGCRGHWDDSGGFPTDLSLTQLKQVLQRP